MQKFIIHIILRRLVGIVCLLLFFYNSNAQLTANFTADKTSGCAPLVVLFSDNSIGNPTSWTWDLGNGIQSMQQNPTTIYFNPGVYHVKLIIKNAAGNTDSIIKSQYITVYSNPVANFSASNTTGCSDLNVQFTDASTTNSGSINYWEWDFGDGTLSNLQNPNHTYLVGGNFTVTLKVKNTFGCINIISKPSYVNVIAGVKANFTFNTILTCTPPATVHFQNTSSGTAITNYLWSFGDGSTSISPNPSYTYTTAGSYTVKLKVSNANGCIDSIEKINVVNIGTVTANFTVPQTVCRNNAFSFQNTSSPNPVSVLWTFGDGSFSTLLNPVKSFSNTGTYQVKLFSNFGSCVDSITKTITVIDKPTASFSHTGNNGACVGPVNVQFVNNSAGADSYTWLFGDGGSSSLDNPSHQYTSSGNYTVTLIAKSNTGCNDTIVKTNYIIIGPPKITSFTGIPFVGCSPYTIFPGANILTAENITSYFWDFGDGSTSSSSNPSHTYSTEGTYAVKLVITTASGCKDSLTMNPAVTLSARPNPSFSATPTIGCAFQNILFTNLTSGVATDFIWNFGDGGTSTSNNPVHNYNDTGYFTVTLVAINNHCKDSVKILNYIYIQPPIAGFNVIQVCDTPFLKRFQNLSRGATSYFWNFGDGSTSTDSLPSHLYATAGSYLVELKVTNGTCEHTRKDTVRVYNELPDFTISSNNLCKNTSVHFETINVDTTKIASYLWKFGNGDSVLTFTPYVNYIYKGAGTFYPSLTITDKNGCKKTKVNVTAMLIKGPLAQFSNPLGACLNSSVNFIDNSIPDTSYPIQQWIWSFGDGNSKSFTVPPFSHIYNTLGSHNVTLKVIDSNGCMDSIFKLQAILITKPIAKIQIPDSVKCLNSSVVFSNQSTGVDLTYLWNFGDGNTSNLISPTHSYSAFGLYSVSLKITDRFGCVDSVNKADAIKVANALANFSLSDSLGLCPPFVLNLSNASQYYSSLMWDFGDGSTSNLQNPIHYYNIPSTYQVKLKAFGYGSCVDSIVKPIILKGPTGTFTYTPLNVCAPTTVSFQASTKNNATFVWDFSDGVIQTTSDSVITHTYTNPGNFIPKMILVDVSGCQVPIVGSDTLKVANVTSHIKVSQTTFCDSTSITFTDSCIVNNDVVTNYLWKFGDGTTSSALSPTHTFSQPGNYPVQLFVTTSFGCQDSSTINPIVRVVRSPQITLNGDSAGCVFAPVNFNGIINVADTSNLIWNWNFGNGNTSNNQIPLPQIYNATGSYNISVEATNSSGCKTVKQKLFTINGLPPVSAGPDSIICRGQSITLSANGASSYVWSNHNTLSCTNCNNPIISPIEPSNQYIVQGTSTVGCIGYDTLLVNVIQPLTIQTGEDKQFCIGSSVEIEASGANTYIWDPAVGLNNANISNPIASPTTTTNYRVIGTDLKNCFSDTGFVKVTVFPMPVFNIIENSVTISAGKSLQLKTTNSSDINNWKWLPNKWISCDNCPQPFINPQKDITYKAIATNAGGCRTEDQITVKVVCGEENIYIPNTFSPNSDAVNDIFYPRGSGLATIKSFRIYNRWGSLVFSKFNVAVNDLTAGWNGTLDGKQMPPDVYVFVLEVVCDNNQLFTFKGDITLIR